MIPEFRQPFNANFTPEKYRRFLAELDRRAGTHVKFRNAETPCFFPEALIGKMVRYGRELMEQLLARPGYLEAAAAAIPPEYRVPNQSAHPLFVQADFGIDAALEPKLVEIQGFPSLYAYQPVLGETYRDVYELDAGLQPALDPGYARLLQEAVLGGRDPAEVVLLEVDPFEQKTLCDFLLTEKLCGIKTISITDVVKRGNRLYYGKTPIRRVYNRAIVDELQRKGIRLAFDFRDDLDVEWAGHPNWYFLISKFSLPFLEHPSVPETRFLSELQGIPDDLENWVLKPLYSFAGLGVVVGPTREQLGVPDPERYILQRRVDFAPVIETPLGPTKAEVRIMYIWLDEPRAVSTIVRMGRGKQMGVDHNRDMEWVGASAGFAV